VTGNCQWPERYRCPTKHDAASLFIGIHQAVDSPAPLVPKKSPGETSLAVESIASRAGKISAPKDTPLTKFAIITRFGILNGRGKEMRY